MEYEFMFVINAVDDDTEKLLVEDLHGFIGGHGGTTLLTIAGTGQDAVEAGHLLLQTLRANDVHVQRVYEDIVSRSQIADRLGITRQAVGLWIRGQRQAARLFPEPHVLGGGGLWLWADVHEWLRVGGLDHDEVSYPSAMDIACLNTLLRVESGSEIDDSVLF